jgi:hypothetical protein
MLHSELFQLIAIYALTSYGKLRLLRIVFELLLLLTLPRISDFGLAILNFSLACLFSMHLMHIQFVSPFANLLGNAGFYLIFLKKVNVGY